MHNTITITLPVLLMSIFSTYSGDVRDGLRHGQGTYWCVDTGSTYTGQWLAGRRQGRGRLSYNNQSAGSGAGEGEEEEEEESYYDGEWVDNQQEGFGTRRYRFVISVYYYDIVYRAGKTLMRGRVVQHCTPLQ